MKTFKEFLVESLAAIAAANALSANMRKKPVTVSKQKPLTAYQQGKKDKASGKTYNNPHEFDPKAGADVNYDHNSYKAGYHE